MTEYVTKKAVRDTAMAIFRDPILVMAVNAAVDATLGVQDICATASAQEYWQEGYQAGKRQVTAEHDRVLRFLRGCTGCRLCVHRNKPPYEEPCCTCIGTLQEKDCWELCEEALEDG